MLETRLKEVGGKHWTGYYFVQFTGVSIFVDNNLCFYCKIMYPKKQNQCVICRKPTRKKPRKSRNKNVHRY